MWGVTGQGTLTFGMRALISAFSSVGCYGARDIDLWEEGIDLLLQFCGVLRGEGH